MEKLVFIYNFENSVFSRNKLEELFFNRCNFYNITILNSDLSKSRFLFGFHEYEDGKTTNSSQEMSLNLSDISEAVFSFIAWSDDDPRNMRINIERINLSQEQLDQAIYEKNRPPKYLIRTNGSKISEHPTLIVNPDRALNGPIVMGVKCRRFVESGEWIPNINDEPKSQEPKEKSYWDQLWYRTFGKGE